MHLYLLTGRLKINVNSRAPHTTYHLTQVARGYEIHAVAEPKLDFWHQTATFTLELYRMDEKLILIVHRQLLSCLGSGEFIPIAIISIYNLWL